VGSVELRPGWVPARGYSGPGRIPLRACTTLSFGIGAMVRLDQEALRKITWRFEGYASIRRRAMCDRYRADTTQGGAWLRQRSQWVDVSIDCSYGS
jgi:hypothetical protein